MKKTFILLTSILAIFFNTTFAQQFSQYFDGADTSYWNSIIMELDTDSTNIWQIGIPHKVIFDSAATVPNVIVTDTVNPYPQNNRSSFIAKIVPWTNWGIFALQWVQKLDMTPDFDGGIVEYSYDHGNAWTNVFNDPYVYNFYGFQAANQDTLLSSGDYAFSGTDSTWRDIWLCFDMSWLSQFSDTILFRFTLDSDSVEYQHEGWMIDNMMAHITIQHTLVDEKSESYLSVYPNPASKTVSVEAQKLQQFHIIEAMTLYNEAGQVVQEWRNIPTKFFFDVSKFSNGRYQLRVQTNIQTETLPLLIQHD